MKRMHGMGMAVILVVLSGAARALPPADPGSAQERPAYAALVKADQARDAGRFEDARADYETAAGLFAALVEQAPNYKPESMQYRLNYCRDQVERMAARLTEAKTPPAEGDSSDSATKPPPADSGATRIGNDKPEDHMVQLEFRIMDLEEENRRLNEQATELAVAMDALETARKENRTLKRDLDASRQSLAAFEADRAQVAQKLQTLRKEKEALQGDHLKLAEDSAQTLADLAAAKTRETEWQAQKSEMGKTMAEMKKNAARQEVALKTAESVRIELDRLREASAGFDQEREMWKQSTAQLRQEAAEANELKRRLVAADLEQAAWIRNRNELERQLSEFRVLLQKSEGERDEVRRAWQQARDNQAAIAGREKEDREQENRDLWQRLSGAVRERDTAQNRNDELAAKILDLDQQLQRSRRTQEAQDARIRELESAMAGQPAASSATAPESDAPGRGNTP